MPFEKGHQVNVKHGYRRCGKQTTTYRTWCDMRNRCANPNIKHFHRYGGRGITVCERWQKFNNFLNDMGEKPDGLTIERIDNDGNYEPSNCKWASWTEQSANRTLADIRGELNPLHKLTWPQVRVIRELKRRGCPVTQRRLAEWFKVDPATIWQIVNGKTWKE